MTTRPMLTNTCPFANIIELPSLADAGFAALQSGDLLAVEAIARLMKRRYAQAEPMAVTLDAIVLLEDVFGGLG